MRRHTAVLLTLLLSLTALPTLADDDEKDRRSVLIERIRQGDCAQALHLGKDGTLLRLGSYGYLGISSTPLTAELRRHFGVPEDVGVMIGSVEDDSPAAAAGLQVGDIITRVDDKDVTSGGRLQRLVRGFEKDDAVTLEYWRGGKVATATVRLGESPRCGFDVGPLLDLRGRAFDLGKLPALEHLWDLREFDSEALDEARERFRDAMKLHEIDGEAMKKAQERLQEALKSQDWEGHLERLRDVDMSQIEERLHEVMERLELLEEEIRDEKDRLHSHDEDGKKDGAKQ